MSRFRKQSCLLAAGLFFVSALQAGTEYTVPPGTPVAANQLLVRFSRGTSIASVGATLLPGSSAQPIPGLQDIYLVRVPSGTSSGYSTQLSQQSLVDYVEPNRLRGTTLVSPNDPSFSSQPWLTNIQAPQAWALLPNTFYTNATIGTAASRVKVAVIDTGADCTHPDFMNASGTSADSASGGQLWFAKSHAYVATTITSPACTWQDDNGHGSHTAGIVAAATNNNTGVASLGYPLELIILKVLDHTGNGADSDVASAIIAATDAGAGVISMSLGGPGYSPTIQAAIDYAWQHNSVVVSATGNGGSSNLFYPGDANFSLGVGATDSSTDQRTSFSNYGFGVDVAAPGWFILSTYMGQGYQTLTGTSMSTPFVAALAGLIELASPNVAAMAVAQRIQQSAESVYDKGGWDGSNTLNTSGLGYGRINAFRAISIGNLRPATVGGIVGQVVDNFGNPVFNATVAVPGQSVTTVTDNTDPTNPSQPTGLFRLSNLTAGATYTVTTSANGFTTSTVKSAVVAGADTSIKIVLGGTTGEFHGVVTDLGTPVVGAVVQALSSGLVQGSAVTDSTGAYSVTLTPGTYDLRASVMYGVTTTVTSKVVANNGSVAVNVAMAKLGTFFGTVKDGTGALVANATISITNATFSAGAVTDASGNYSTIGIPAGNYTLTATPSNGIGPATVSNLAIGNDLNLRQDFFVNSSTITVATNPAGLSIIVDGTTYSAPQTFHFTPASSHALSVPSPQVGGVGTQYVFLNWSDSQVISHSISVPASDTTYTANFVTQYQLTLSSSPVAAGTISLNPAAANNFYNAGTPVQLTAVANSGYQLASFSGALTGPANPQTLNMTAPLSVSAAFIAGTTIASNPAGRSITVDNVSYTVPQTFYWTAATNHTVSLSSPQAGASNTRYVFANWSDGLAQAHTISALSTPATYTANFTTQYLLTVAATPNAGGLLAPSPSSSDGYYASGTAVQLTAAPSTGFNFANFSGDLSGSSNPQSVTVSAPRSVVGNFSVIGTVSLDHSKLFFGSGGGFITSPQTLHVTASGGWTASSNQANIAISPSSGSGNGTILVTASAGPNGTITVTPTGANAVAKQTTVTISTVTPGLPFGSFDTPSNGTSGIAGAIAVTGWALDSIEVTKVDLWREPLVSEGSALVYIGDAAFVDGARPDVESANPTTPLDYRGGWGYLLLTNFLPAASGGTAGNGTFKLHAIAHNKSGSQADLGVKQITVDNAHASKPFGTIDTPSQGGTAAGNQYFNFGWALTQQPYIIPLDGSTITVTVDGVPLGHPVYNQYRSDIANAFPGLMNSSGPVGFFALDTTTLTNGVHTIGWTVYDSANRGDGIGSRYFTVSNGGSGVTTPDAPFMSTDTVRLRGRNKSEMVKPDARGMHRIKLSQMSRIELELGASNGSLIVQGESRALPLGSSLKRGVFYWQPPAGFLGDYQFKFQRPNGKQVRVKVSVEPTFPTMLQ